jgi:radical SAM modification target selenobiotic family peptide
LKEGGEQMDKQDLKKILAGISVASLLAGASIGCTTQQPQQPAPPSKEAAPAQTQETPAPGKKAPAPGG